MQKILFDIAWWSQEKSGKTKHDTLNQIDGSTYLSLALTSAANLNNQSGKCCQAFVNADNTPLLTLF